MQGQKLFCSFSVVDRVMISVDASRTQKSLNFRGTLAQDGLNVKKKGQSNSPYVSQIFCSFNNFLDKTVFQKVFA